MTMHSNILYTFCKIALFYRITVRAIFVSIF